MLGDMIVFEKSVQASLNNFQAYSEERNRVIGKLKEGVVGVSHDGNSALSMELKGKAAVISDADTASLNGFLEGIMEMLDRDTKDGISLLHRYNRAAKDEYADLFPTLKYEAPSC